MSCYSTSVEVVRAPGTKTIIKIVKLKSKKEQKVSKGTILCLFKNDEDDTVRKLKSPTTGTVKEVFMKEGEEFLAGHPILSIETVKCSHPTVMKDMCADCGADLRLEHSTAGNRKEDVSASVAMVHSIPELIVSEEQAKELGKEDEERLLKTRKLVLLVDLDQTLIHTTNDIIPANLKDVHHFQLWHGNQLLWYHTHLRPGTNHFLESISKLYELHICTFGVRMYAHTIAKILDPDGKYFSHRILSRDECFNATSKTANLKALFPCGDAMVCIIDDREDVWNNVPNLIHVKPYRFFQGTADINAPPGLAKTEEDDKPLVHRVRRVSQSSTDSQKDNDSETKTGDQEGTEQSVKETNEVTAVTNEGIVKLASSETDVETKGEQDVAGGDAGVICTDGDQSVETLGEKADAMETEQVEGHKVESESDTKQVKQEKMEMGSGDTAEEVPPKEPDKTVAENDKTETDLKEKELVHEEGSDIKDDKVEDGEKGVTADIAEMEEELIEWDDEDDYLFYLEENLKKIHNAFFSFQDQLKERDNQESPIKEKPSLKNIIPYIKKKTLKGCNIVFSGVIPTNMVAEKSRAHIIAKALGANIQQNVIPRKVDRENATTHVVAAKLGTSKVRSAQKHKGIQLVNPDWLWSCSERWERVEEALFPLTKDTDDNPGSDSPNPDKMLINSRDPRKRKKEYNDETESKGKRKKGELDSAGNLSQENVISDMDIENTPSAEDKDVFEDDIFKTESVSGTVGQTDFEEDPFGLARGPKEKKFSLSYNPIYAFSDDDIAYMDKEVDDIMDEDEEDDPSSEDDDARDTRLRESVLKSSVRDGESSSEESLSGETPRGWGLKRMLSPKSSSSEEDICSKVCLQQTEDQESDSENVMKKYEDIMTAFAPETESEEYEESIGSVDDEIADAVEKEFLS